MDNFNFAFFGTPLLSSETLDILKDNGYLPSIIITAPDKKSGRGLLLNETSVSAWAKKYNIKCLKPEKINQDFLDEFKKLNIDLSIVVAYGKILPEKLIKIPELGTINIHYSLLPKYRGASPLESTLLNGDTKTGVSIQQMVFKLDSGPIIEDKETLIGPNETKDELRDNLIKLGGDLLCEVIPKILNKKIILTEQDETKATYCTKINKEDGEIDINGNPIENYNKYRAFSGWPGIFFFTERHGKKIRVKIKQAIYQNNQFTIKRVTPEGKKEIDYSDFLKQN
jgi:methionyl-tRNA formyltransferase